MIIHRIDTRHDFVTLTPESPDDLWALRRVISKGDLVASESSRVIKETSEYARPDKERVKVKITLEVEHVNLDNTISRLRVAGKIVDVSNDALTKNSFHSLSISEGHSIGIKKPSGFTSVQLNIVKNSGSQADSYAVVAVDSREAGIGIVRGTHLQILPSVESGVSGKMYHESRKAPSSYFDKIADSLSVVYPRDSPVFILGPGNTKNALGNMLAQNRKEFSPLKVLEGSDVAGEDGVYVSLRNPNLQVALGETRLAKASKVVAEIMRRVSLGDSRVAFAFKECLNAAVAGAVESLLFSENAFTKGTDEQQLVDLLNSVEEFRGETFLLDDSTDLGRQVDTLGGLVALLRFTMKSKGD